MGKKKRHGAIALLEFETVAAGVLAGDVMVKRAPIALMRCGSIHPGHFLILVGGSVASTEEAYAAGLQVGESQGAIRGKVFLGDVHPSLHDAVLAAVDAAVKSTPVVLSEVRLGDDLGGHALALMSGDLFDVETALDICSERSGEQLLARTLLPRLDHDLRSILDQGTRFGTCTTWEPSGAEYPEEVACSWDA